MKALVFLLLFWASFWIGWPILLLLPVLYVAAAWGSRLDTKQPPKDHVAPPPPPPFGGTGRKINK